MFSKMKIPLLSSFCFKFLVLLSWTGITIATDTLKPQQSLATNDSLISAQNRFELGFFSPGDSRKLYLGMWYGQIPKHTPVWVANRDKPLNDSSGALRIGSDGNLVLLDETERIIWSTNIQNLSSGSTYAQLLDSGNLVLKDSTEATLWQSFDYPAHVLLAGMKFGVDLRTGLNRSLTSWKNSNDPSPGEYSFGMYLQGLPQAVMWKGSSRHFRSGPWNGVDLGGLVLKDDLPVTQFVTVNQEEVIYRYSINNNASRIMFTLDFSGVLQFLLWDDNQKDFRLLRAIPQDYCAQFAYCGPNSICTINDLRLCSCFSGYTPKNPEDWDVQVWPGGCIRKAPFDCPKGEGFIEYEGLKMPDLFNFRVNNNLSVEQCREECLKNCSCTAYTVSDVTNGGHGCLFWYGDLIDLKKISERLSQTLYVRATASEMEALLKKKNRTAVIVPTVIASALLILAVLFFIWRRRSQRKGVEQEYGLRDEVTDDEDLGVPSFDVTTIAKATENFSSVNKIGEGGFGPVYKGTLSTGQEIAVKRLSEDSGQGLQELKNEVMLIAKLQHRNLVKLLGCCIQRHERILIYEYMRNGSLDSYIFGGNAAKKHLLAWRRRFSIIVGIARGILYLHQDSRLRIIHRDLKASNVLLDSEMNPKISDFGMARMFQEGQFATKTRRVVGTFGYMAPEYAIRGIVSMKSDVFSFGVLVLEIISGKRNSHFHHSDNDLSLLGHAWHLWLEGRASELIDPFIEDSFPVSEVLRCIQVGLLCVQQQPDDRPTMSALLLMLDSETTILPQPKRPGFHTEKWFDNETDSLTSGRVFTAADETTILVEGR